MELRYDLRDARDTLIDLLPLKSTYPIRNLPVRSERDIVPYKGFTYVIIDFSQPEVFYEVYDDLGQKVNEKVKGNGGSLSIKTGELTKEDYTFSVIATKAISGLSKQLLETVTVKTGVDTSLNVYPKLPVIDYNTTATIVVEDAQRGNKYQVLDLNGAALSQPTDSGDGGNLEITMTNPLKEDIQVKINVTNIKTSQAGVLNIQPTIIVSPNDALVPALKAPLVDYNGTGIIVLNSTQASVNYQLRFEAIDDDTPEKILPQNTLLGNPVNGNGGTIELPMSPMLEDLTVNIIATKIGSGVQKELQTLVVIPVRPDPGKKLSVVEDPIIPGNGATIKVSNTQRGILYQLRSVPDNKEIDWPRYHSKNYGIGKARLEIEFAIDAFNDDSIYLPTGPMTQTATFNVLAIKATTKATAQLTDTITGIIKP